MSNPKEIIEKWKKKENLRSILDLSNWDIDELPEIPDEVEFLDISNTSIREITKLPKKLKWLACRHLLYVKSFPIFPESLHFIDCRWCDVLEPCQFPKHITKVRSHFKQILKERYVKKTPSEIILKERLDEIQNTPKKTLDISNLGLKELPANLPDKIKRLNCSGNPLISINKLPSSLKILHCCNTFIRQLDNIPDGLIKLYCINTHIMSLNNLPNSLKVLVADECSNIQAITFLPSSLQVLSLEKTSIKSIKYFPSTLRKLFLRKTNLEYVPEIPNGVVQMYCPIKYSQRNLLKMTGLINIIAFDTSDSI